jgi:PAS domain S-box-containing protein
MSRRAVGSTRMGEGQRRPRLRTSVTFDANSTMSALEASEALLRLPDGVLLTDERQRICWSNPAAARLTGWTRHELKGMPVGLLINREQLDAIASARGIEPGQLQRYHCLLQEKSGEQREVSVSVGRADAVHPAATIYVLRDLGRQRELERRLLAQLDENQALKAFGRQAAGVVHDLRHLNNLFGITVKNLRRHRDDQAFVDEALRLLENVGDRMRQLLGALSAEPPHPGLRRQPTDLRNLVRHALELLGGMGREAVSGTAVTGCAEPLLGEVDPDEMLRVIFNVLLNAFDAVKKDGRVTVWGGYDVSGDCLRVIVEDDGPGLAADYLAHDLFRPFRSTKPDGLGLGLYQAKYIVESHGGTLAVANREDGPGARVSIVLPAAAEPVRREWLTMTEQGTHATT